jgi:hypothetical protein
MLPRFGASSAGVSAIGLNRWENTHAPKMATEAKAIAPIVTIVFNRGLDTGSAASGQRKAPLIPIKFLAGEG